jgi:hypothetical protein
MNIVNQVVNAGCPHVGLFQSRFSALQPPSSTMPVLFRRGGAFAVNPRWRRA